VPTPTPGDPADPPIDPDCPAPDFDFDYSIDCVESPEPEILPFEAQNFLEYAITGFSNKFPFDIIGQFSSSVGSSCPVFTISLLTETRVVEFCLAKDFVAYFKYAVWFAFAIRLILH
jgi:hypothetical protein